MAKFEVGKFYKTVGGWKALVIFDSSLYPDEEKMLGTSLYCIHFPTGNFSKQNWTTPPIAHGSYGEAITFFSVNERPCFGKHPSDLTEEVWD